MLTAEKRGWFTQALRERGFRVRDSEANFVTVAVEDPAETARRLRDDHAIAVRDTQDMGYLGHVRISLGDKGELERALLALSDTH
jgi:histidinol-phosphate/aromatic aminotransferase/cobyric acid decarboxylase-like protein